MTMVKTVEKTEEKGVEKVGGRIGTGIGGVVVVATVDLGLIHALDLVHDLIHVLVIGTMTEEVVIEEEVGRRIEIEIGMEEKKDVLLVHLARHAGREIGIGVDQGPIHTVILVQDPTHDLGLGHGHDLVVMIREVIREEEEIAIVVIVDRNDNDENNNDLIHAAGE